MDPLTTISTRVTTQTERAAPEQVPNNAGGYGFQVGDDALIHRFLTLGTTGGTYYVGEKDTTLAAADVVLKAARERGPWLVDRIREVSVAGRAPKQNPAVLALAATAGLGDDDGRKAALAALPAVCRTGSHLLMFARYVEQFRGWGRGLRRAVGGWYTDRDADALAYQMVKYRQRDGWSQRDVLRVAHPDTDDTATNALLRWVTQGDISDDVPHLVHGFLEAQAATKPSDWTRLVRDYPLSWEMLPDAALNEVEVWRALVGKGMPQTALLRQLPRLTRVGLFDDRAMRSLVETQLVDAERLQKARVHPVSVLLGARTYASGQSVRGQSSWTPVRQIIDALDAAFYNAFAAVEPSGKRHLLALDVSGSMTAPAGGTPISCREASAALALVTMATEPDTTVVGFTGDRGMRRSLAHYSYGVSTFGGRAETQLTELALSPRQRLDDAIRSISNLPFGGTDCSLPMLWAQQTGQDFDTIAVYTDSETWAGSIHPHQALAQYRRHVGHDVRQVVVGMTTTNISIADPADPSSLDIAGFDAAVPNLIADFSRGAV